MIPTLAKERFKIKTFNVLLKCAEPVGDALTNPQKVVDAARAIFKLLDADQEHFVQFFLNAQNEVIGYKTVSSGTIDQVAVYPRIVLRNAILAGAAGIILVHNHPSGHCDPYEEDKRLTKTIVDAGRVLDIRVLDHIVLGDARHGHVSFLERGLI